MSNVLGHQKIASGSLATAATLTVPDGTQVAWLQATGANIRYTLDGSTTPTASVGMILVAGAHRPMEISVTAGLRDAQFILESGTPDLLVTYFG